jgi:hypothetical protein
MMPHERAPSPPVFATPCVAGDALALPGLDNSVRILELVDGSCCTGIPVGVPLGAPPLELDGRMFVRGPDSSLPVRSIA